MQEPTNITEIEDESNLIIVDGVEIKNPHPGQPFDHKGFEAYKRSVEYQLYVIKPYNVDTQWLVNQFIREVSPVATYKLIKSGQAPVKKLPPLKKVRPPYEPPPPQDPSITARARQVQAVLSDPRYLVNTGIHLGCPQCGSTNLIEIGKSGSGFGFFGSIPWVIVASVADSIFASTQPMRVQCNYCNAVFGVKS